MKLEESAVRCREAQRLVSRQAIEQCNEHFVEEPGKLILRERGTVRELVFQCRDLEPDVVVLPDLSAIPKTDALVGMLCAEVATGA